MKLTLRSFFVLLLVCVSSAAFAISRIQGALTDQSGNPIINAVVNVTQGNLPVGSGLTDFDGNYTVAPVPPGTYTVTFTYLNFRDVVPGVQVGADAIATVNNKMNTSASTSATGGKDVVVTAVKPFKKPLIDFKAPPHGMRTADELEHAPTTSQIEMAGLTTQGYQQRRSGTLSLGGGRGTNTTVIVDGVMLAAGNAQFADQAQGSVDQVSTYTSGIPARYGDATGGIVTITTKGITPKLRGGVRLQHSIDGYNNNLGSFNLAGPLWSKRIDSTTKRPILGFTLDGQAEYGKDENPSYYKNYVLSGDKLAELEAHPLTRLPNNSGNPATYYATESIKESDLTAQKRRPGMDYKRGQLAGKLIFPLTDKLNIVAGATMNGYERSNYDQDYTAFTSDGQARRNAISGRGFIRFTQKFASGASDSGKSSISNAYYTIQADYQKDYVTTQDRNHKQNTFDYGYVGKFEQLYDSTFVPGYDDGLGIYGVRLTGFRPTGIRYTPSDLNPIMSNYTTDYFNITPTPTTSINDIAGGKGLRNGDLPDKAYNLWQNVGRAPTGWNKSNNDQIAVTVDAAFDYNYKRTKHSIELGLYYQQRNERYYSVNGSALWGLMRQLTNNVVNLSEIQDTVPAYIVKNGVRYTPDDVRSGRVVVGPNDTIVYDRLVRSEFQTQFDKNLRTKLNKSNSDYINTDEYGPNTYSLDMFAPDDLWLNGQKRAEYFGYDWMGNRETGTVNFNDFWTKKDPTGSFLTRPIGAYRPNYIAGYLSDYIQFKDFLITLGVRVERFDANTKVLKDPYSLLPIKTVADITNGTVVPANIGSNYVVYVGENGSVNPTVIGYRNGDTWYDKNGTEVQNPDVLKTSTNSSNLQPWLQKSASGTVPSIKDESYNPNLTFTDYKPQVNVMPRINFSFPLNERALFYAHYDVLVMRPVSTSPGGTNFATPLDYLLLQENASSIIGNPDLKPEKVIDYQVGFQQQLGKNSSVTLNAFFKGRKDQIQIRSYYDAYPTTYYTYGNRDFSTYKGFSLSYDLRRLGKSPISMLINYTLSFNEGTGSDASSSNAGDGNIVSGSSVLASYISAGLPNSRNLFPLTNDSRHNINTTIDYRYRTDEGPMIGSSHFLQNAGASLIFRTRSGEPYTRYSNPISYGNSGGVIEGGVNASRLPWHYMFDLNVDKDFTLNFGKKSSDDMIGRKPGLTFNIFCYVQNLLNTKDIVGVYGFTGSPTDDGYLTTAQGQTVANQKQDIQSYKDLYHLRTQDINKLNNPRTIVLGLKLNF